MRIGRACSTNESFLKSTKTVLQRMIRQGAHVKDLTKILKKTFGRHDELKSFAVNSVEFVSPLL